MRVVLLDTFNPLSPSPRHALFPYTPGSTGYQLWSLLHSRTKATKEQFLVSFMRYNSLNAMKWEPWAAREELKDLIPQLKGREIVVLGGALRTMIGLTSELILPQSGHEATWRLLPNPSVDYSWYQDDGNRELAACLMEEMYHKGMAHTGRSLTTVETER
jgi:hypothetical protein